MIADSRWRANSGRSRRRTRGFCARTPADRLAGIAVRIEGDGNTGLDDRRKREECGLPGVATTARHIVS
jgi:hypothetical protein